ncbi:hypothetical protein GOP47_0003455 [Adiantum capillus-veneris]|uniref:Malectin-like domain-containing protein n=1 Tax=Adiantum capillus-veneris TaxID=13818 RepID=A0A9D4VE12_ADICA|nr:hypothetical protein GOP47_0003455 [Adiantum capillus-veneris]
MALPRSSASPVRLVPLLLFLCFCSSVSSATTFNARDEYRIACGVSSNLTDSQGRLWTGDASNAASGNPYLNLNLGKDINASSSSQNINLPDPVPFSSAHIFTSPATYSFPVSPGRHWIRLYFYPFDFSTYSISDAILTVETDTYTLMQNVSLSYVMSALNLGFIFEEFSVNVTENFLTLNFIPGSSPNAYAMVNGIEILSMPDDMYVNSLNAVNLDAVIPFPVPGTALETMFRLNVGGQAIVESNDALGRLWATDEAHIFGAQQGVATSVPHAISYGTLNNFTAPEGVYTSARFMTNYNDVNMQFNLTWNISVDPNFTYYMRFHFCEIQYTKSNMRVFDIFINSQLATPSPYDVAGAAGGPFVASVLDFAMPFQPTDAPFITVELHPNIISRPAYYNAILNGLEIFKMNDSAGNLQGPRPPPLIVFISFNRDIKQKVCGNYRRSCGLDSCFSCSLHYPVMLLPEKQEERWRPFSLMAATSFSWRQITLYCKKAFDNFSKEWHGQLCLICAIQRLQILHLL